MKAEYAAKGLDHEPDSFVLYRILGNDLHPRHKRGQTLNNLAFILDHEPELEACQKRWVVNRIFDSEHEAGIMRLLRERKQSYLHISFDWDEYAKVGWDWESLPERDFFQSEAFAKLQPQQKIRAEIQARRHKNNYVMNNNAARNAALREGRTLAKWVLPFDGNCFLTKSAWSTIVRAVKMQPYLKYFVVPMARIIDNSKLLKPGFNPDPKDEPQILFRRDALETFNEAFPYGRRPKVELFWRLGVPGNWDFWQDDRWDLPRPEHALEAGQFGPTGWVARLHSGQAHLESTSKRGPKDRGRARLQAILETIDWLDREVITCRLKPKPLMSYADERIAELKHAGAGGEEAARGLIARLCSEAEAALRRGPYSVIDKTTLPPSRNPHDYWHPAPYWWPNPDTPDGLPYVWRDGERVPGTAFYGPGSNQYDRTNLQRLFDDTTVLALASTICGERRYAEHGARLVRRWFLDPESGMTPHMRYAQVRVGHHDNEGTAQGIIEMKDLYFFLDAVRLLDRSGAFAKEDRAAFAAWLRCYLQWLSESPQGKLERGARNNHGTFYDLQVAAIAAYLGDVRTLAETFRRADERLWLQFEADGRQPEELARTATKHYCCFNLQGWVNLARLAARCGTDLWGANDASRPSLKIALAWFLDFRNKPWPYPQGAPFDQHRLLPLTFAYRDHYGDLPGFDEAPERFACPPLFNPHYATKPFWMLA